VCRTGAGTLAGRPRPLTGVDRPGCTVAIAGGNLAIVSDRERTLSRDLAAEDRWTADGVADRWDELAADIETMRMQPGYCAQRVRSAGSVGKPPAPLV
jgi:hypothetical protein